MSHFDFSPTPIEKHTELSSELGCELFIKRDDLFPIAGGGSKARMLQYILFDAISNNADYILTAGGPYSNFNRALALMCGLHGLSMRLVIYDKNTHIGRDSLNKRICDLCEVEYVHCDSSRVKETLDEQLKTLTAGGHNVYRVWGGGKSAQGVKAYFDCINEIAKQIEFKPDYIFVPVGTGTTFSGLSLACSSYFPNCNVVGISIARDLNTASSVIRQIMDEFTSYFSLPKLSYNITNHILDSYILGGYGCSNDKLTVFLKTLACRHGMLLDNIYVGKALYGLYQEVKGSKKYRNKNVLFINTGGIYNL